LRIDQQAAIEGIVRELSTRAVPIREKEFSLVAGTFGYTDGYITWRLRSFRQSQNNLQFFGAR